MNHWTDPVFLFPPHGRNPNKSEGLLRAPTSHTELSRWLTNLRTHTIEIIIIKHKYRSVLYKVWRLNRAVLEQGSGGMKGFLSHRRVITLGSVGVPVVVLPLAFILFPRASVWQTSKSGWNNEQKHTHTTSPSCPYDAVLTRGKWISKRVCNRCRNGSDWLLCVLLLFCLLINARRGVNFWSPRMN